MEAFYEVRRLRRVKVYSPTKANRDRFAKEMTGKLDIEVTAVDGPEKVVREADIVATCTDSTRTVFDEPVWLKQGAHITCVRACEIGRAAGLRYVYAGNLPGRVGRWENTYCPACDELLVERYGYLWMAARECLRPVLVRRLDRFVRGPPAGEAEG